MINEIPTTLTFRNRFEQSINLREGYKPNENVFFMNSRFEKRDMSCSHSIEEILTEWGVHRHYDRVVERMTAYTSDNETKKPRNDRMVVVQYDSGTLDTNHDEQKLLYFVVSANDGTFISNGGALFQHGKLSFHT